MTIQEYITDQLRFWALVEKTLDVLEWKLRSYTSHLPEHTSLGIPTSELTKKVDYLMNHIAQMRVSSQDFLPKRTMNHDTQPVWLVNRLLEEVKQRPPFIPSLPRRHSFN